MPLIVRNMAVPTADVSTNVLERDVVGNKTDTAVTTATTTKSLMAYTKGILSRMNVGVPQVTIYSKSDLTAATAWTTGNSPITIFTVTGTCLINCFGVVTTPITSTGGTGTIALGTAAGTGDLIAATTLDGTVLHTAKYIWTSTAGVKTVYPMPGSGSWYAISGTNVILTIATNSITAGGLDIYCVWMPLSSGASVA